MEEDSFSDKRFCLCGCGALVEGYGWSRKLGRHLKSWINGHNTRIRHKQTHPMWKGGTMRHKGYIMVRCDGHPRAWYRGNYVYEHVLVMEKHLGRYISPGEVVHHVDHNRGNNRLENLRIMTKAEHIRLHAKENGKKWGRGRPRKS